MSVLRKINSSSFDGVVELWECARDYQILSEGVIDSRVATHDFFETLPPNHLKSDKFIFGIYDGCQLIGIIDLIKNFSEIGEWHIGLMLIIPEFRGKNFGRKSHQELVEFVKKQGGNK